MNDDDNRVFPRVKVGIEVECPSGAISARAVLADISLSGALLVTAEVVPAIGDSVTIQFGLTESGGPAYGEVIRHTSDGFAIQFDRIYASVQSIIGVYRT